MQRDHRGMSDRALAVLAAYWAALRLDRPYPARAQIDPRGFGATIDRVFLASPPETAADAAPAPTTAPGAAVARLRVVGQRLHMMLGRSLRDTPLAGLLGGLAEGEDDTDPATLARCAGAFAVLDAGQPLLAVLRPVEARVVGWASAETHLPDVPCLLLPLGDRHGRPAHVIGALGLDAWPASARLRGFRLAGVEIAPSGLSLPRPAPRKPFALSLPPQTSRPMADPGAPGLAEAAAGWEAAARPVAGDPAPLAGPTAAPASPRPFRAQLRIIRGGLADPAPLPGEAERPPKTG